MTAAINGPSNPIISQVEKSGSQKTAIFLRVSPGISTVIRQDYHDFPDLTSCRHSMFS